MPERTAHQRTHSQLLLQRLLSLRQGASPFTLLLDTVEQSSRPLVREFVERAKVSKTTVIQVSFETLRQPKDTTYFIRGHKKSLSQLQQEIISLYTPNTPTLLIIDTIHPLISLQISTLPLSGFLTSLLPSPQIALLATYHTSIPLSSSSSAVPTNPYSPSPISLLSYLATTIINISPLHHVLSEKRARERAIAPPSYGLENGLEGVLLGSGANGGARSSDGGRALVLRIEHRRKSGRAVGIDAVLTPSKPGIPTTVGLLEEHPLYAPVADSTAEQTEELVSTFNLGLTEKQRQDREGVVLPYFDAQKGAGPGEGGRILYQMGEEDLGDWDEEEDEI